VLEGDKEPLPQLLLLVGLEELEDLSHRRAADLTTHTLQPLRGLLGREVLSPVAVVEVVEEGPKGLAPVAQEPLEELVELEESSSEGHILRW
jgi:hypothetical protein